MVLNLGKKNKWEEDQAERSFVWVYLSIVASHVLQKVIQQVSLISLEKIFINVGSMGAVIVTISALKTEQAKVVLKSLAMMMKVG
jgi:hypothetical protein